MTAAIRDITVRKRAEQHLEQMEGRYRGLLEAAPDAMVVVNDSTTIRRILEEILISWGMRPTVVDSGAAALRAMELAHQNARPFPLILLDHHMTNMDGFEVAEQIAQRPYLAGSTIVMQEAAPRATRSECGS